MRHNIKVISVDLDGTLFKTDGSIEEITIASLIRCKKAGIILIFNTARPLKMIPKSLYATFIEDYWVFSNGTTCVKSQEEIFHTTMGNDCIGEIIEKLHSEYGSYFFSVEVKGNIFTASVIEETNNKYFADYMSVGEIKKQAINKIILIAEKRDFPINALNGLLGSALRVLVTEKGKYVQIMPENISKLSAVEEILKSNKLTISNVLSFGDDLNDLELIIASHVGVAMDNADPILKNHANYITTSNDQNGIGVFIDTFLLPISKNIPINL